jgi:hypothetical protein
LEHLVAHGLDERDRAPVVLGEVVALVTEQTPPVGAGSPRGCREDERKAAVTREL